MEQIVVKVGSNKSRPNTRRIWCQTGILSQYGFSKSSGYVITYDEVNCEVIIETSVLSERIVSGTVERPIIDIENFKIKEMFDGVDYVHIVIENDRITVSASDRAKMIQNARRKAANHDMTYVELYCGGGTLSSAMADIGAIPKCVVDMDVEMNSINKKKAEMGMYHSLHVLENYRRNFKECQVIQAPVNQLDMKKRLPSAGILAAGIPCQPVSSQGVTKRKSLGIAIKDEALPSLVFPVIEAVLAVEPHTIIIEETENFSSTYSAAFLKAVFTDFGYTIHETTVDGRVINAQTMRRRYCMVATVADNFFFDFQPLESKTIESILEGDTEDHNWKSFDGYKKREEKNLAEGRNFTMNVVHYEDTIVGTIGAGYAKARVSEPLLKHPAKELYRLFTPREIARLHGLSESYELPESFTTACHILGNGVMAEGWRQVGQSVKAAISA